MRKTVERERIEMFIRDVQEVCRRHRVKIVGTSINEGVSAEIEILDKDDQHEFGVGYLDRWNEVGDGIASNCVAGIMPEDKP